MPTTRWHQTETARSRTKGWSRPQRKIALTRMQARKAWGNRNQVERQRGQAENRSVFVCSIVRSASMRFAVTPLLSARHRFQFSVPFRIIST
jgi:hypothetical protein